MTDGLLTDTDIEEALSGVYVSAIASYIGYTVAHRNFDRDGIDVTIEAGSSFRPKLDLQLKASINVDDSRDKISYFCPKRNYDLLRLQTQTPRLLVLMKLPKDKEEWIHVSTEKLTLKHCAYWMSLKGFPASENNTGEIVHIPVQNRFDEDALRLLMEQSRTGFIS